MQLKELYTDIIILSILFIFTCLSLAAEAATTSPANRALSYLELSDEYSIKEEKAISETESKIKLINDYQKTSHDAFVVKHNTDQWMIILKLGTLNTGPIEVEEMLLIYAKDKAKLPSQRSEELNSFIGDKYHGATLSTRPGINFYAMLGLNQKDQSVKYMFNKLGIKHSGEQKIYGSMDTYHKKSDIRLNTTLASTKQLDFPSWLHLKPTEDLELEIACSFQLSNIFKKGARNPFNCGSIFVKTEAEFHSGNTDLDLDIKMGLGKTTYKSENSKTSQSDKKEDSTTNISKFIDYKFILEGFVKGAHKGDSVKVAGIELEELILAFEQTFYSKKSLASGELLDLPKSVYTLGGKLKLAESNAELYGILSLSENPFNLGFSAQVDKITFEELTLLGFNLAINSEAAEIPSDLKTKINQLPLKEIYLTNVTLTYAPEISDAANVRENGFTASGSLTIFGHLAGSVDVNVGSDGVRTRDSIQPFSQPGLKVKKANLNIFIPTSKSNKMKSAIVNNLNFILIDLNAEIAGLEEQIKFKIGLDGFSYIFNANLSKDIGLTLIAEAPISAFKDVKKFRFGTNLKTGNSDSYHNLITKLRSSLANNKDLSSQITQMRPNFSALQKDIDNAKKETNNAKKAYQKVRAKAQKDVDKITKPIKKAEKFLNKKNSIYNSAKNSWNSWKKKRNGYDSYKLDKIAHAEAKVIYYEGKKDTAWGVLKLAKSALKAVKESIDFIPVDAYPEVIEKLAYYREQQYTLAIAKGALEAAKHADKDLKQFSDLINNNLNFFNIDSILLSGDLESGKALAATMTLSGTSFGEQWSASSTILLDKPSSNKLDDNLLTITESLFTPAKYSALRAKSSYSPSVYAEYPTGTILSYTWQRYVNKKVNQREVYADIGFAGVKDQAKALVVDKKNQLWTMANGHWSLLKRNVLRVDGNAKGDIWIIGKDHKIYYLLSQSKNWKNISGWATDISVGNDGTVVVIGKNSSIWMYTINKKWKQIEGRAVRVSVSPKGIPWVVSDTHKIYQYHPDIKKWKETTGRGVDIAIAGNDVAWVLDIHGNVWIFSKGNNEWTKLNGAGNALTTDNKNLPWVVGKHYGIWQSSGPATH